MNTIAVILVVLLAVVLPATIVGVMFVWAAIKDGTGDTAGAAIEVTELAVLVLFSLR